MISELCFPELLTWCFPNECLLVFEAVILGWVGERKVEREDLCVLLRMGSEKKGRLQQVFCNKTGGETGLIESGRADKEVKTCSFRFFKAIWYFYPQTFQTTGWGRGIESSSYQALKMVNMLLVPHTLGSLLCDPACWTGKKVYVQGHLPRGWWPVAKAPWSRRCRREVLPVSPSLNDSDDELKVILSLASHDISAEITPASLGPVHGACEPALFFWLCGQNTPWFTFPEQVWTSVWAPRSVSVLVVIVVSWGQGAALNWASKRKHFCEDDNSSIWLCWYL